jgi:hypothetical protein
MKNARKIRELIRSIAQAESYEIHQGFVRAVSGDLCNVEIDDGVTVYDVRLNVIPEMEFGILLTPEIDSPCVIARVENGQDFQLLQCAKLKKLRIRVGSLLFEMDEEKIFFNEGNQGGMVLLNPLVAEMNKLQTNQNLLRTAISQIAAGLNPSVLPGISATVEATLANVQPLNTTTLENTKVRQ